MQLLQFILDVYSLTLGWLLEKWSIFGQRKMEFADLMEIIGRQLFG